MGALETVADRLEWARRDGVSLLDLSDLGLRTLPQEVADLTRVEELDASGNRLTEFPDSVLELAGLSMLEDDERERFEESVEDLAVCRAPRVGPNHVGTVEALLKLRTADHQGA